MHISSTTANQVWNPLSLQRASGGSGDPTTESRHRHDGAEGTHAPSRGIEPGKGATIDLFA